VTIAIKDKVINKDPDAVNVIVISAADIVHRNVVPVLQNILATRDRRGLVTLLLCNAQRQAEKKREKRFHSYIPSYEYLYFASKINSAYMKVCLPKIT
jgi:hypothetical protein